MASGCSRTADKAVWAGRLETAKRTDARYQPLGAEEHSTYSGKILLNEDNFWRPTFWEAGFLQNKEKRHFPPRFSGRDMQEKRLRAAHRGFTPINAP